MKKNKKAFNFTSLNGEKMKQIKGGTVTNPTQTSTNSAAVSLPAGCSGCDRAGSNSVCPSMGSW